MTDPIVKTISVDCTPDHAFDVFVNRISRWWPLDTHAVSVAQGKPALSVVVEPKLGGAIYEVMHDGTRSDWGEVLVFEPGARLAITWHPGGGADKATRVDVEFTAVRNGQTQVTLTHSQWEVWGATRRKTKTTTTADGTWCWACVLRRSHKPDQRKGRPLGPPLC